MIDILGIKLYMFRAVPLSITRSLALNTQQWYMSYRFADSWRVVPSWSRSQTVSKPVWHIPLLCVQWKTVDDGQRNCLKHVDFYSKNKLEKLVHLVGFIIRIYDSAVTVMGGILCFMKLGVLGDVVRIARRSAYCET